MQGVRYTSITPPPDNGCADCSALNSQRAFCPAHRPAGAPCVWCLGRGFQVAAGRWVRCEE